MEGLEIDDGLAVEADLVGGADQEPHRVLVVQDHLRLEMRAALGLFAQLDQAPRGVAVLVTASKERFTS